VRRDRRVSEAGNGNPAKWREVKNEGDSPVWHFRCPDSLWEIDSCKSSETANFPSKKQRFPFCMGKNIAWYGRDQGFWSSRLARIGMNDLNLYHY